MCLTGAREKNTSEGDRENDTGQKKAERKGMRREKCLIELCDTTPGAGKGGNVGTAGEDDEQVHFVVSLAEMCLSLATQPHSFTAWRTGEEGAPVSSSNQSLQNILSKFDRLNFHWYKVIVSLPPISWSSEVATGV